MMLKAGVEADTKVIGACAEACDVAKAGHWLCTMLTAGVEVDTINYTTMIEA